MDVKLSGIVEVLFLDLPWKFQLYVSFTVVFMDLQILKIGCVNYACFPKSGHILYTVRRKILTVENIDEFDEFSAIRQYFPYQNFPFS